LGQEERQLLQPSDAVMPIVHIHRASPYTDLGLPHGLELYHATWRAQLLFYDL
jgi:hypothetical protein